MSVSWGKDEIIDRINRGEVVSLDEAIYAVVDFERNARRRRLNVRQALDLKGLRRTFLATIRDLNWYRIITWGGCLTFSLMVWYYIFHI